MATPWKGQKKRDAEPSEMVAVRLPTKLKAEVQDIATKGDSTLAAITRHSLEKFVEENRDAPAVTPPGDLFE